MSLGISWSRDATSPLISSWVSMGCAGPDAGWSSSRIAAMCSGAPGDSSVMKALSSGSSGSRLHARDPRRPEAAGAARGGRELLGGLEADVLDALDHELSDAVAGLHDEGRHRVRVHEHDAELTAIAGVDEARRVEARHTVVHREAAAREHEAGVADGDRDGDAAADRRPAAAGGQLGALVGHEVAARVAVMGVLGEPRAPVEGDDGNRDHARRLAKLASAPPGDRARRSRRDAAVGDLVCSRCSSGWTSR